MASAFFSARLARRSGDRLSGLGLFPVFGLCFFSFWGIWTVKDFLEGRGRVFCVSICLKLLFDFFLMFWTLVEVCSKTICLVSWFHHRICCFTVLVCLIFDGWLVLGLLELGRVCCLLVACCLCLLMTDCICWICCFVLLWVDVVVAFVLCGKPIIDQKPLSERLEVYTLD